MIPHTMSQMAKRSDSVKNEDTYKEVRVFQYGHITARVHIPDLTDAEYERRRKIVEKAAVALLLSREGETN